MKIAVPFEDGQVFQHFGRSAQFKFYEAENGQLLRTEVIPTNGQGHGALAGFLVQHGADVVLRKPKRYELCRNSVYKRRHGDLWPKDGTDCSRTIF